MKLIIEIPEGVYNQIVEEDLNGIMANAIKHGMPLPNGHGRLIDADETLKAMNTWDKFGFDHTGCFVREPKDDYVTYVHYEDMVKSVSGAPTIIEADNEVNYYEN